jgi:hypothetical protein
MSCDVNTFVVPKAHGLKDSKSEAPRKDATFPIRRCGRFEAGTVGAIRGEEF